jgi:hypothetical protein
VISSLDTHESVKSLTPVGFSEAQAEALTAVVKRAVDIDFSNLATKTDLAELRRELSSEIATVRHELSNEIAALRHELSNEITAARREMAQLELRLIKWVIGVGIAATLAVGGMVWTATQFLLRALPHS